MIKNRKAFTIVELVIVIAVIGILAGVLIPTFSNIIKNAHISNDQQVAGILTKDLLLANDGARIEDEATLMAKLNEIENIDKKLTPQSAQYGYHFWFDMKNQQVVVKTAADVAAIVPESQGESAAIDDESTVKAVNSEGEANAPQIPKADTISFRNMYNNGYYLIDKSGGDLADAINLVDELKDTATHDNLFALLGAVIQEDKVAADKVVELVESTVIFTNNGSFYQAGATNVYFAKVASLAIPANHYDRTSGSSVETVVDSSNVASSLLPTPTGEVDIPKYVICISDYSMYFNGEAYIAIDSDKLSKVLCSNATNAIINGGLRIEDDGFVDLEGNPVPDMTLTSAAGRFQANDFVIDYDQNGTSGNEIKFNSSTGKNVLYIYAGAYANGKGMISFYIKDPNGTAVSSTVATWTPDADGLISFKSEDNANGENGNARVEDIADDLSTTITAEAVMLNGETVTKTIDVKFVKPTGASAFIESATSPIIIDGTSASRYWYYTSGASLQPSNAMISYSENIFDNPGKIIVEPVEDSIFTVPENSNTIKLGGEGDVTKFVVSVDGFLATTVNMKVIDNTNAAAKVKFIHTRTADYKYYIGFDGTSTIKLSDIFAARAADADLVGATIKIYDGLLFGDAIDDGALINATYDDPDTDVVETLAPDGLTAVYTDVLSGDWKNQTIKFVYDKTKFGTFTPTTICIEIIPVDGVTLLEQFVLVEGTNVFDTTALQSAASAGGNVVLQSSLNLDSLTDSYNITLGEGQTFYGNGYVISATQYAASAVDSFPTEAYYLCTESSCENYNKIWSEDTCGTSIKQWFAHGKKPVNTGSGYKSNVYLIKLEGGTIDNIYIDGPVYGDLQYHENEFNATDGNKYVQKPYYVSGVKVVGNATISNSYISGFRQPVQVFGTSGTDGTTLTLENTTLRGGNYANLNLVSGNLYLKNVTTVQDQNGQTATLGGTNSVVGVGIAAELGAITSLIDIDGYFNQYNWIEKNKTATLPVIDGIELDTVFSYIFNGVLGQKIGSFLPYIHESADGTKAYVNAGIVFSYVSNSDIDSKYDGSSAVKIDPNETDREEYKDANGNVVYAEGDLIKVELPLFSTWEYGALKLLFGKDAKVAIYSYKDGEKFDSNDNLTNAGDASIIRLPSTGHPIVYTGYYDGTGAYATWYNASANASNK